MMGQSLRWRLPRKKFTLHPVSLRRFVSLRWFCPPPLLLQPCTAHILKCTMLSFPSGLLPVETIDVEERTNEWLVIMASDVECLHWSIRPPQSPTCLTMIRVPPFRHRRPSCLCRSCTTFICFLQGRLSSWPAYGSGKLCQSDISYI